MKPSLRIAATINLFAALAALAGCASAPLPLSQQFRAQTQPLPNEANALVYFFNETHAYQSSFFSFTRIGVPYVIHDGGERGAEIATLGRSCWKCSSQTYTWRYIAPGPHTLTPMFIDGRGSGVSLSVTLEGGKTYYYQVVQMPAQWSQDITLVPVAENDAVRAMQSYDYCDNGPCG